MANLKFGLDIGPNSFGWTLIDEEAKKIHAVGVRVFPEGVKKEKGQEKSKSQSRREARTIRRQIQRRARRRRLLRRELAQAGLLPNDPNELENLLHAKKRENKPSPYELRARAVKEKLSLHEIGRIILHLAQRRGYKSNRKADKPEDKKKGGILAEMDHLDNKIKSSGAETMGSYFAGVERNYDRIRLNPDEHIRRWHTKREKYEYEFDRIWKQQKTFHPDTLTDSLKYGRQKEKPVFPKVPDPLKKGCSPLAEYGVYGLLFFHRKLKPPAKAVIGNCGLEPTEKRCPRAARIAQRFRMVQEVNNLRVLDSVKGENRPLNADERKRLLNLLYEKKEIYFDAIRKELDLDASVRFTIERDRFSLATNAARKYFGRRWKTMKTESRNKIISALFSTTSEDGKIELFVKNGLSTTDAGKLAKRDLREKMKGNRTEVELHGKNGIGSRWKTMAEEVKDKVIDILIKEDQDSEAVRRLAVECHLTPQEAQGALTVYLPEGYASYSQRAIAKLLPFMEEKGMTLMGKDTSNSAMHAAGYMRPDERTIHQIRFLPLPPRFTNPIVRQAMFEVRKTVNAILRELVYKQGHTISEIYVEIIRDAKRSFNERMKIKDDIDENNARREEAKEAIREFDPSIKLTRSTVNRYLYWKEQNEKCPFCGEPISPQQLLNDLGEVDVAHILPKWQSLDFSMANEVVAHRKCNLDMKDRTPWEWLGEGNPDEYSRVLDRASKLPPAKMQRFLQKKANTEEFVNRQLNDTAYITVCVSQYLQCLGAKPICTRGQMTKELRNFWGLDTILNPKGEGEKNRDDHRHHAIDAILIALTDHKRLFALANKKENIPPPWKDKNGFRDDVRTAVLSINVSHRVMRKLNGPLHDAFFNGITQKKDGQGKNPADRPWARTFNKVTGEMVPWAEDENLFVRRRPVDSLEKAEDLDKVRDPIIREILRQHLRDGKTFKNNPPMMPSGVPIKKVRMVETSNTMQMVSKKRYYHFVEPNSNHHMVIYNLFDMNGEPIGANGKPIRDSNKKQLRDDEIITMFEAARRGKNGLPLIDKTQKEDVQKVGRKEIRVIKKFAFSLSINEMFMLEMTDGSHVLHRIQKLSKGIITLRPHTYAGVVDNHDKPPKVQRKKPNTLLGCKVAVDRLGRIRRAND